MKKQRLLFISLVVFIGIICLLFIQLINDSKNNSKYINNNNELRKMLETTRHHVDILIKIENGQGEYLDPSNVFDNQKYLLTTDFYKLENSFNDYRNNITGWDAIENKIVSTSRALDKNGYDGRKINLIKLNDLKKLIDKLLEHNKVLKWLSQLISILLASFLIASIIIRSIVVNEFQKLILKCSDKLCMIIQSCISNNKKDVEKEIYLLGKDIMDKFPQMNNELEPVANIIKISIKRVLFIVDRNDLNIIAKECSNANDILNEAIQKCGKTKSDIIIGGSSVITYIISALSVVASFTDILSKILFL